MRDTVVARTRPPRGVAVHDLRGSGRRRTRVPQPLESSVAKVKNDPMKTSNKLVRSSSDRMIAGVCGGLAEYFGVDPTLVRVGYVLVSILSAGFPGVLVYIILAVLMPQR